MWENAGNNVSDPGSAWIRIRFASWILIQMHDKLNQKAKIVTIDNIFTHKKTTNYVIQIFYLTIFKVE
jgi:hypothetical protein